MIRKIGLVVVTIYLLLVMGGLLLDRDKEELRWKQSLSVEVKHDAYTDMNEWTSFNVKRGDVWQAMTDDPILISPNLPVQADTKQTYLHIGMSTEGDHVQVFWRGPNESFAEERSIVFNGGDAIEMMVKGDVEQIRVDPAEQTGNTFTINQVDVKKYK